MPLFFYIGLWIVLGLFSSCMLVISKDGFIPLPKKLMMRKIYRDVITRSQWDVDSNANYSILLS